MLIAFKDGPLHDSIINITKQCKAKYTTTTTPSPSSRAPPQQSQGSTQRSLMISCRPANTSKRSKVPPYSCQKLKSTKMNPPMSMQRAILLLSYMRQTTKDPPPRNHSVASQLLSQNQIRPSASLKRIGWRSSSGASRGPKELQAIRASSSLAQLLLRRSWQIQSSWQTLICLLRRLIECLIAIKPR